MSVNHTRLELEGKSPGLHFHFIYMYLLYKDIYICMYMIIYQSNQTIYLLN